MKELTKTVKDFLEFAESFNPDNSVSFHRAISMVHSLSESIHNVKNEGVANDLIIRELNEVREIHQKSPFISRLQNWPCGYQRDYQTIEYICDCENKSKENTLEYYLEWYALNSAIGQQHRNKVQIQTNYILDVISKINHANILIIGCGSGRDIRNIQSQIEKSNCNFYLNDIDENAINFTKDKLSEATLSKVTFINESVLQVIKNKKYSSIKYDLILFGGVFDYLSDKAIIMILKKMYNLMLAENGLIIFNLSSV